MEILYSQEIAFFPQHLVEPIARAMVEESAKVQPGEHVLISADPGGRQLVLLLARFAGERGAQVRYHLLDRELDAAIAASAPLDFLECPFASDVGEMEWAQVAFVVRCPRNAAALQEVSVERRKLLLKATSEITHRRLYQTRWTLISWPTPQEARDDDLSFEEYATLFFEACNQPWHQVHETHTRLIEQLNRGAELHFVIPAPDGNERRHTDLRLSIAGMTFCNSTITRNFPGSEVFSAPLRESVAGTVYAPGKFYFDGKPLRDLWFRFARGKIIEFDAAEGRADLQEILSYDEGACYLGEIALGTNSGLTRKMVNTLLAEKSGGSFHFALGRAYEYDTYNGEPVVVDNGNRSAIHWDITVSMVGTAGEIYLDGQLLQRGGEFIAPELASLNPRVE